MNSDNLLIYMYLLHSTLQIRTIQFGPSKTAKAEKTHQYSGI